jgi:hypothetical protein
MVEHMQILLVGNLKLLYGKEMAENSSVIRLPLRANRTMLLTCVDVANTALVPVATVTCAPNSRTRFPARQLDHYPKRN